MAARRLFQGLQRRLLSGPAALRTGQERVFVVGVGMTKFDKVLDA